MSARTRLRRLLLVLAIPTLAIAPAWAECLEDDRVEICDEQVCIGQIFVELQPGISVESITGANGLFVLDEIPALRFYLLGIEVPLGQDVTVVVDEAVDELEQMDTRVDRAEAHRHLETPEGTQLSIPDLGDEGQPPPQQQDYMDQPASGIVNTTAAQQRQTGAGVTVAVIDTGMSFSHPVTHARIMAPGKDFAGGDGTAHAQPNDDDDDGDGLVDEGLHHATFVTGVVHLVAPDARVLPIRVLNADGKGTAFSVARGIFQAIDARADVINLSHGMLHDARPVEKAIQAAIDAGIVVVAAAGNRGEPIVDGTIVDNCVSYPASEPGVIAVAAVDQNLVRWQFSDYGPGVSLSAPGTDIESTYGDAEFATWSGTSFAAPFVAGAAALILEKYPCLSPAEVRGLLMSTTQADNNPDLPGMMGQGVLDLDALTLALATDRCSLRLEQTQAGTVATWSPVAGAASYDLVRGDLDNIVLIPGAPDDAVDLGPVACLIDDSLETDSLLAPDDVVTLPGQVHFYLFRDDTDPFYGFDSQGHPRSPGAGDCAGGP